jgi:hypothetical protein
MKFSHVAVNIVKKHVNIQIADLALEIVDQDAFVEMDLLEMKDHKDVSIELNVLKLNLQDVEEMNISQDAGLPQDVKILVQILTDQHTLDVLAYLDVFVLMVTSKMIKAVVS